MLSDSTSRLLGALTDALGGGPAVEPLPPEPTATRTPGADAAPSTPTLLRPTDAGEDTAVVIRTSGSTGAPKRTALTAEALAASSEATARYLRAEGQWLLALPTHYVAGVSVLTRSLFAGTQPVEMGPGRFTAEGFVAAAAGLTDRTRFVSLVPTQLQRLLTAPTDATLAALQRFDAILVGGGRTPDAVRAEAAKHGLRLRLTYGMSETCGGCVYDGVPLPGVRVSDEGGRLSLGGPMVAAGYLGDVERTAAHFSTAADGTRWFLTDDVGSYLPDPVTDGTGLVSVEGRVDDVIITGGVKVSAGAVQRVIEGVPEAGQVLIVGVPDSQWGATVGLVYTGTADVAVLLHAVRAELGAAAVPKRWARVDALPMTSTGKPDRQAAIARLSGVSQ